MLGLNMLVCFIIPILSREIQSAYLRLDECYCGMNLGKGATVVPTSQCNMPCAGGAGTVSSCDAANTNCGGPALLSVYHATDLESLAPCGCGAPHDGWGAIEDIFSSFF